MKDTPTSQTQNDLLYTQDQVDLLIEQRVSETHIKEVNFRLDDAIQRLWKLDRQACVDWLKEQEGYYYLNSGDQTK